MIFIRHSVIIIIIMMCVVWFWMNKMWKRHRTPTEKQVALLILPSSPATANIQYAFFTSISASKISGGDGTIGAAAPDKN